MKSFFHHVWDWLKNVAAHEATWEKAAQTTLKIAAPLLNSLITLTAGSAVADRVAGIVAQIQADMAGADAVISGAGTGSGGVTVTSFLDSVKANLGTLLTDADIKNHAEFSKISSIANTVIGEVEAITSAMPAPSSPAPATPGASA
jgi:hypothetical protein